MLESNRSRRPRGLRSLIPASAWAALVQHGVSANHAARQRLLRQGTLGGWVLVCLSGRVKVVYAEPDGREVLLAVRGPGDVLGELSGRDGNPRSTTVEAIEPGVTSRLSDRQFNERIHDLGIEGALNSYILGKLRESAAHAWRLAHRTTPTRLADLILALIDAAGPDHPRPATISMSQEELASGLGLARSAITPVLAEWKAAGVIRTARGKIEVVDVQAIASAVVSTSGQNHA